MKYKLLIVSMNYPAQSSIKKYLNSLFKDYIDIESCLCHEIASENINCYDLVLFSAKSVLDKCRNMLNDNARYVVCKRAIDYNHLDKILAITPSTDVYLVNDTKESSYDVIEQLNTIGITHYNFIPYYIGSGNINNSIDTAVTVGEVHLVPEHIKNVVDIGSRITDITTVYEIITYLGLPIRLANEVIQNYNTHIMKLLKESTLQLSKIYKTQQVTQTIINNIENGVCLISETGIIQIVNDNFCDMMSISKQNIIDKNLFEVLKENNIDIDLKSIMNMNYIITKIQKENVMVSAYEICDISTKKSFLINMNYTENITNKEIVIRRVAKENKKNELYNFTDYITHNKNALELIEKAKKIALRDSNVLIQGESGTGKEILAQSIHLNSPRKGHPFIPVNFAAIQPSLLESELFGYEEGSFTGAKKGGKKGLLEMAHKGTIFLDEIGDATMSFQTKLLRVLQEREIRRIGGIEIIPIDIRIIVATNKNLSELVEKGRFREDLFYRINVMAIDTIPLRDRKDDIILLFNYFMKNYFDNNDITINDVCSENLIDYIISYDWPGNTRELINICEYFSCIINYDKKLEIKDLPRYILNRKAPVEESISKIEKDILKIIYHNPKIGRNKIYEILLKDGIDITEGRIRGILNSLTDKKFIKVNKTKGGCEVTSIAEIILD